ncbi:unnamed protein product [Acanthosepion pharaonis]|uniref:Uncharacterized protein n=1 Tax=Acanthosepion pharaonis TaxID=158019 RepID=A0A812DRC2_ACAPH|nr:unnamed protein product [Sepia pharaonis]
MENAADKVLNIISCHLKLLLHNLRYLTVKHSVFSSPSAFYCSIDYALLEVLFLPTCFFLHYFSFFKLVLSVYFLLSSSFVHLFVHSFFLLVTLSFACFFILISNYILFSSLPSFPINSIIIMKAIYVITPTDNTNQCVAPLPFRLPSAHALRSHAHPVPSILAVCGRRTPMRQSLCEQTKISFGTCFFCLHFLSS